MDAKRNVELKRAVDAVGLPSASINEVAQAPEPVRRAKAPIAREIERYLMTGDEVAALMHCSKRTISRLVERDGFPAPIKRAGGLLYRRDEVYAYLQRKSDQRMRMAS